MIVLLSGAAFGAAIVIITGLVKFAQAAAAAFGDLDIDATREDDRKL